MGKTRSKKLKYTVFTYFGSSVLIFCFIIGVMTIIISQYIIRVNASSHYVDTARYVGKNVRRELDDIKDICNYLFVNADVKKVISNYPYLNYDYVHSVDILDGLLLQNVMSNVFSNATAIVLFDNHEIVYKFTSDTNLGRSFNFDKMHMSSAFEEAKQAQRMIISKNNYSNDERVGNYITVFRSVMDKHYNQIIGGMMLTFNISLLDNAMLETNRVAGFNTYLVSGEGEVLNTNDAALPASVIENIPAFHAVDGDVQVITLMQEELMVFYYPIEAYNCYVVCLLSTADLFRQSWVLVPVIVFAVVFAILAMLLIWHYLNKRVLSPILQIRDSLNLAKEGEHLPIILDRHSGIEEVEALINSYNQNVRYIDEMAERLSEEKTSYKDLEYRALQSQINSHFITNTLNAIRWIAIIQKANKIKEIIDAFSRLLKSTWQGLANDSTFGKEISNVRDYIFIQQITHSYNCSVFYDVDEELLDRRCMKFIIQPLVENAFFHGIAPKDGDGNIWVSLKKARYMDRDIVMAKVEDDGVGMDENTLASVLGQKKHDSSFNGIGISNINERLQLKYGHGYGISIESKQGCYTRMNMILPLLDDERNQDV